MSALTSSAAIDTASADPSVRTLFGHPRGLATLFLTEMWERFTHYGMRAILVLFMVTAVSEGGLGIKDQAASSIYGLFVASCYLLSLLGGWVADRLVGAQRAVIGGAVFILLGNAMLASGSTPVFFLGLTAIAFGVGLLKPNVSVLVGQLYPGGGARRAAGLAAAGGVCDGADRGGDARRQRHNPHRCAGDGAGELLDHRTDRGGLLRVSPFVRRLVGDGTPARVRDHRAVRRRHPVLRGPGADRDLAHAVRRALHEP